jgi:mono/diheme cytochrome c family protein
MTRHPVRPSSARRFLTGFLTGLALVLVGSACVSTNTYPIDFFSEMHYQKSFRDQEPPRLDVPAGVVPISGGEPYYTMEEARNLRNPLANDPQAVALGKQLYELNCVTCHGQQGNGNGPLAVYWNIVQGAVPPTNLKDPRVVARTDGELYWILTHGYSSPEHQVKYPHDLTNMPAYGKLLTPEERWALVSYMRELQKQQ